MTGTSRALARPGVQLALVMIGALALRLFFFGGLRGEDDTAYWVVADELRAGRYVPDSFASLRWMVVLPLALSQAVIGAREAAAMVVPLAYSLAEVALAFAIGRLAGGAAVGVVAATLIAVLPEAVVHGTDLHPDVALGVYWALAMYATMRGEQAGSAGRAWFVTAGAALGAATWSKEYGPLLLAVLALRCAWLRRVPRGYAWLAGAFACVLAVDAVAMTWIAGAPWYRYASPMRWAQAQQVEKLAESYGWMLAFPRMLLDPLAGHFGYFAGVFYLVLAATVWAWRWRVPPGIAMLTWWAPLLAFFTFMPTDVTFTRPPILPFPRYLHPLLVPFAVTVALWLVVALGSRPRARVALVGALAACSLIGASIAQSDVRVWVLPARRMAPVIAALPRDTVVAADHTTAVVLPILLGPDGRIVVPYPAARLPDAPRPTVVVRDPVFLATDLKLARPVPAVVVDPPRDWTKLADVPRPRRASIRQMLGAWVGVRRSPVMPDADRAVTLWSVARSP